MDSVLTADQRAVIKALAVLDGVGSRDAIEAVLSASGIASALPDLASRNLLSIRKRARTREQTAQRGDDREYGIHGVVRAYYYNRLDSAELKLMHRRAGEFYECVEANPLVAGQHFTQAEEAVDAARVLTGNFWTLMNQGQSQALRPMLESFSSTQVEPHQWVSICIGRAEIATLLGESEAARERYQDALAELAALRDSLDTPLREARVHRGLAYISVRLSEYERAERECRSGLDLIAALEPPNAERARLYAQLTEVQMQHGDFAGAAESCGLGIAALPREPEARGERIALLQRTATIDGQRGNYVKAIESLEQSLTVARKVGDPSLTVRLLNNLGNYLKRAGHYEPALRYYEESLRLEEQIGDVAGRIVILINLGNLLREQGDDDAALQYYGEARDVSKRIRMRKMLAKVTLNMGILQYEHANFVAAQASFEEALAVYIALEDLENRSETQYRLGEVALAQRDYQTALDQGLQALDLARRIESKVYASCALRVVGEAALGKGDLDGAARQLAQAWELQTQVGDRYDQTLILVALARLALAQANHDQAAARLEQARELALYQRSPFLKRLIESLQSDIARTTETRAYAAGAD
jgi:tetratricopeptide (TPR) repeat protein